MNRKCPACNRQPHATMELRMHCKSPTCTWIVCPMPDCRQTFDQRGRHCAAHN